MYLYFLKKNAPLLEASMVGPTNIDSSIQNRICMYGKLNLYVCYF